MQALTASRPRTLAPTGAQTFTMRQAFGTTPAERTTTPRFDRAARLAFLVESGRVAVADARDAYRVALRDLAREVGAAFRNPLAPDPAPLDMFGNRWVTPNADIWAEGRQCLDFAIDTVLRAGVENSYDLVGVPGRVVFGVARAVDIFGWPRIEAACVNALNGAGNRMAAIEPRAATASDRALIGGSAPPAARVYELRHVRDAAAAGFLEFEEAVHSLLAFATCQRHAAEDVSFSDAPP